MSKIIKTTLTNINDCNNLNYVNLLWKIILKPCNLKTLIFSSTEYTQLLVINSLIKCIQH